MRKPFTVSIEERRRAIDLLIEGNSVESTCQILQARFHPQSNVEDVSRVYFPKTGIFRLSHLVGASSATLDEYYERLVERSIRQRQRVDDLNVRLKQDPELRKKQLKGLNELLEDPQRRAQRAQNNAASQHRRGIYERRSQEYRQKWQDPLYRAKMMAALTSPTMRQFRSQLLSLEERQSKVAEGRRRYWKNWHQLPPEQQEAERTRRREVINSPENRVRMEAEKQRFWEEWRQLPPEIQAKLYSEEERRRRRVAAMQPEVQQKFREGYRRYVEARRILRAIHVYETPAGWEGTERVPVYAPDYPEVVSQQETVECVHQALAALDVRSRVLICKLFDIELGAEDPESVIEGISESEQDSLLREAFESLAQNSSLALIMANEGGP